MKYAILRWMLCVMVGARVGIIECAHATEIRYTWSEAGFNGGGEVTGSFIINDNYPTRTGFLGREALVGFQAHWSGNIYSQPFTWALADVSLSSDTEFTWYPPDNALEQMALDLGGPVFYDPLIPVIEDFRAGAMDPSGYDIPEYYGSGPLISSAEVVPDRGHTVMLLGFALTVLLVARWSGFFNRKQVSL